MATAACIGWHPYSSTSFAERQNPISGSGEGHCQFHHLKLAGLSKDWDVPAPLLAGHQAACCSFSIISIFCTALCLPFCFHGTLLTCLQCLCWQTPCFLKIPMPVARLALPAALAGWWRPPRLEEQVVTGRHLLYHSLKHLAFQAHSIPDIHHHPRFQIIISISQ